MHACNRRTFMTRVVLGTAALAAVGRACADPSAAGGSATTCANCQYFTPAGNGAGSCAFAGGKQVSADGGCGNFSATPGR